MFTLYKGKEGTLWKDIKFVGKGELDEVLKKFKPKDKDYILWWLINNSRVPGAYMNRPICELFLNYFSKDNVNILEYKSDFVAGFYDNVARNRSWGLLK